MRLGKGKSLFLALGIIESKLSVILSGSKSVLRERREHNLVDATARIGIAHTERLLDVSLGRGGVVALTDQVRHGVDVDNPSCVTTR